MRDLRPDVLEHLEALVGCDTQNPPREIGESGIFEYLRAHLPGFDLEAFDLGDGCMGLHAVRGEPEILFNFHLDTVPAADGWSRDPFSLDVSVYRAFGLGACDIKGASACMLSAVAESDADAALLFTSDEEAGSSRCIRHFLEGAPDYLGVIVAEPTGGRAVAEHRGIVTATGRFEGVAGHASNPRGLEDNALHHAARWADAALAAAETEQEHSYRGLDGIRFNLGRLEGGVKPNVIAPEASVRFGFRPRPDQEADDLLRRLQQLAPDHERVDWEEGFRAPALPAGDASGEAADANRRLANRLGLQVDDAVDFWTEAALFSRAGYPTLVFGPGDIAQAHTADEWVALEQLDGVLDAYLEILNR